VALARAIMLARVLRWREEWQAEMAARVGEKSGKANGHAAAAKVYRPHRRTDTAAAQFAGAVARNELGRFYWSGAQEDALAEARRSKTRNKKPRKAAAE